MGQMPLAQASEKRDPSCSFLAPGLFPPDEVVPSARGLQGHLALLQLLPLCHHPAKKPLGVSKGASAKRSRAGGLREGLTLLGDALPQVQLLSHQGHQGVKVQAGSCSHAAVPGKEEGSLREEPSLCSLVR